MKLVSGDRAVAGTLEAEGRGVQVRSLVNSWDGATRIVVKHFQIARDGYTAYRSYHCERVIYVLCGKGMLRTVAGECNLASGDTALLQGGEKHQIVNSGVDALSFLCVTPTEIE